MASARMQSVREWIDDQIGQTANDDKVMALIAVELADFDDMVTIFGSIVMDEATECVERQLQDTARRSFEGEVAISRNTIGHRFFVAFRAPRVDAYFSAAARHLSNAVAGVLEVRGIELRMRCLIGISWQCRLRSAGLPMTAASLFQSAETALVQAKKQEAGNVAVFSADFLQETEFRVTMLRDIQRALERDEFALHYQPRWNFAESCCDSFEALLRWRHAERGNVAPLSFIPLAEQSGLILPITHWVLRRALSQARDWTDRWGWAPRVSINVPSAFITLPGIDLLVSSLAEQSCADVAQIEFEITEGTFVRDLPATLRNLQKLRDIGVRVYVDDFGTGFSSLALLKNLPIDGVKVDRSFVSDIDGSYTNQAMLRAILDMLACLNLHVVVEGIETIRQAELLTTMRCDEVQGYLIGMPVPAEQVTGPAAKDAPALRGDAANWPIPATPHSSASGRPARVAGTRRSFGGSCWTAN